MRRWILAVLTIMLLFLTACGGSANTETETRPGTTQWEEHLEETTSVNRTSGTGSAWQADDTWNLWGSLNDIYISCKNWLKEDSHDSATIMVYSTNGELAGLICEFLFRGIPGKRGPSVKEDPDYPY